MRFAPLALLPYDWTVALGAVRDLDRDLLRAYDCPVAENMRGCGRAGKLGAVSIQQYREQ